jgi:hypothetical protein
MEIMIKHDILGLQVSMLDVFTMDIDEPRKDLSSVNFGQIFSQSTLLDY